MSTDVALNYLEKDIEEPAFQGVHGYCAVINDVFDFLNSRRKFFYQK